MAADFAGMHWTLQRKAVGTTDLPSWSLQHWRRGFKLHRYFTRCMMSYVMYIYVPTCVFFASFSHPSFVFLHIWCPCEISPSSFCLWPLANLTSCSSWWTIWAGPTWASTGILPFPSPLWRPIWIAWPVTRLLLVNLMGEALRYMMIHVSFFVQAYPYLRFFLGCEYVWMISRGTGSKLSQSHPRLNYLCISILEVTIWICIVNSYTIVYLIILSH